MTTRRLTRQLGLLGPLTIICGSLVTALAYSGKVGERYSFLNHFVSELGEAGVSEWAAVFNVSLFVGGLCITGFMLGMAKLFGNRFGTLFGGVGLVTGIAGSLVGVLPMNNLDAHILVAMWFFRAALVSSAMFAIYVLASRQDRFARWTGIPAASISVITAVFLFVLEPADSGGHGLMLSANRPSVWPSAILEWGIFLSIMVWVLATSLSLTSRAARHQ